jgi:hypothetical protein
VGEERSPRVPKRSLQPELHIRCALLLAFSGGLLLAASGRQLLAGCGSRLLAGSRLIAVNRCRSRRSHRSRRSSILLLAASGRRLLAGCGSRLRQPAATAGCSPSAAGCVDGSSAMGYPKLRGTWATVRGRYADLRTSPTAFDRPTDSLLYISACQRLFADKLRVEFDRCLLTSYYRDAPFAVLRAGTSV